MVIKKIYNNNIVLVEDKDQKEMILLGRGLAFGKKAGERITAENAEKRFVIDSPELTSRFSELMRQIPANHLELSWQIIEEAQKELHTTFSDAIYIGLTDHINYALHRYKQNLPLKNHLLWEIKRFYPHEFDLGRYALKLIKERLDVELPEDEAGFIAMHFVNAEYGTNIRDAFRFPNQLKDILEITSDELGIVLDERTLHYERFVTHLKFLLQRVYRRELLPNEENELAELMRTKYPKEYACSCKIAGYIEENTDCRLSGEEVMYLAIHIRRVTMAED